jgi:hypothetical protein
MAACLLMRVFTLATVAQSALATGSARLACSLLLAASACSRPLNSADFRREAERAYAEAHPGWTVGHRSDMSTTFVRGDQIDTLDIGGMFAAYQKSGVSGSAFFEKWVGEQEMEAKARRRTLEQAKSDVIPVIKSGSWIRVQDLGAIGPRELHDRIRPWRKDVATDVYMLLGIPEEKLGLRFTSVEEVKDSKENVDAWLDRAVQNLRARVATSTGSEIRGTNNRLLVYDLSGNDNISALILDPSFRQKMLEKFGRDELGAAAPIRNVLIVFDHNELTAVKPVRARAHQLYDTQNHPAFRGLLKFDRSSISIFEPAKPEEKKKPVE